MVQCQRSSKRSCNVESLGTNRGSFFFLYCRLGKIESVQPARRHPLKYNHSCMKIQIIRIEEFDNLFSLKEKITHAKSSRVILIDTPDSPILKDQKIANLVKRCAQKSGREIGVITQNPDAIWTLRHLKINSFPDLLSAQQFQWEFDLKNDAHEFPGIQSRSQFDHPIRNNKEIPSWLRYISFGLGIFAVLVLALIFIPGADVEVTVPKQIQQIQVPVVFVENLDSDQISSLVLKPVSMEVEAFHTVQVNGTKWIPDAKAQGKIEFANLTPDSIMVPRGLVLVSSKDLTKEYVIVESGELDGGPDSRITLLVESVKPGSTGNAEPGEVTTILGQYGLQLRVRNPEAIIGGSDVEQPYPSDEDKNQLLALATNDLKSSALKDIEKNLDDELFIIPQTLEISQIITEDYFPSDFTSSKTLSLTMKANITVYGASKQHISTFAKPYLDALLPSRISAYGDIKIDKLQVDGVSADGRVKALVSVSRNTRLEMDPVDLAGFIAGKSTSEAIKRLSQEYQLSTPPLISSHPGWLKFLPFLPFRINITLVG